MKKIIEVKKNKNPILVGTGNEEIKTPIEITFTIDEKEYLTLTKVLNEYKWNIYDALTIFCEYANDIIPNFESIVNWQGVSTDWLLDKRECITPKDLEE